MKKTSSYKHSYGLKKTIVCIIASFPILGYAQNITDTVHSLKEITIEAKEKVKSKTLALDVPLYYLPITTGSVKASELEMRSVVKMENAVLFIPGLRMRTTYGGFQELSIRGFNNSPIMIDGVRDLRTAVNSSAPLPDLSFIESIELIRGSASVLYGHSTVGGILNIVSKSPKPYNSINARLSYGSWENKQASISFGGNIYKSLNYQAVINYGDSEGYRHTNDKRFSGYLALSYDISKNQYIELRSRFNRDRYGLDMGLPPTMSEDIFNQDGTKFLSAGQMLPNLNKRARYDNESDKLINNGSSFILKYSNQISDKFKIEDRIAYTYDNIDYLGSESFKFDKESSNPIYKHYYIKNNDKVYINLDTMKVGGTYRFAYTTKTIDNQLETSGSINMGDLSTT